MVLTKEKIKEAEDKNELLQEVFESICDWSDGATESSDMCSEEVLELQRKYHEGFAEVERRIDAKILSDEEYGRQKLEAFQKEKETLMNQRNAIMKSMIEDTVQEIEKKKKIIELVRAGAVASTDKGKEIARLEQEIEELKKRCEKRDEIFKNKERELDEEEQDIRQSYFYTPEKAEALRKETFERYEKHYNTKREELLSQKEELISKKEKQLWDELKKKIPSENIRLLYQGLEICRINSARIWEKKDNRRYLTIGKKVLEKDEWTSEKVSAFEREYPFMNEGTAVWFPYTVNKNCEVRLPILVYEENDRDKNFQEKFKTLCTAYCLSRGGEPLQILHTEDCVPEEFLPGEYCLTNPQIFYRVPKGKENLCLEILRDYCEKIRKILKDTQCNNITEYNEKHESGKLGNCLLVMGDLAESFGEKEFEMLVRLTNEGGKYGVKILTGVNFSRLLRGKRENSWEFYNRILTQTGYGYEPKEDSFTAIGRKEGKLKIFTLDSWYDINRMLLKHESVGNGLPVADVQILEEQPEKEAVNNDRLSEFGKEIVKY